MKRTYHSRKTLVLVLLALATATGCSKLMARDQLNKGVQAFKAGQYDTAIEHFQKAMQLDPGLLNARLYLATAYASQYIPGAPSDENIRTGRQAIQVFQDVLAKDPNNLTAIDYIGSLLYNMGATPFDAKKFEDSKAYYEKHIRLNPNDPVPYYWVGVDDWTLAFRANKQMRAEYNLRAKKRLEDIDPLPRSLSSEFAQKYGRAVQEGIDSLQNAIQRRPDYDDAMSYLNLLLRQKADMETSADAREADLKQADDLAAKVNTIRQKRMENPQQSS